MLNEHGILLLIEKRFYYKKEYKLLAYFVKLTGQILVWKIVSEITLELVTYVHSRTVSRDTF